MPKPYPTHVKTRTYQINNELKMYTMVRKCV